MFLKRSYSVLQFDDATIFSKLLDEDDVNCSTLLSTSPSAPSSSVASSSSFWSATSSSSSFLVSSSMALLSRLATSSVFCGKITFHKSNFWCKIYNKVATVVSFYLILCLIWFACAISTLQKTQNTCFEIIKPYSYLTFKRSWWLFILEAIFFPGVWGICPKK